MLSIEVIEMTWVLEDLFPAHDNYTTVLIVETLWNAREDHDERKKFCLRCLTDVHDEEMGPRTFGKVVELALVCNCPDEGPLLSKFTDAEIHDIFLTVDVGLIFKGKELETFCRLPRWERPKWLRDRNSKFDYYHHLPPSWNID